VSIPAEAGTSLDTTPVAVAASGGQIVAVGGPGCTASGSGGVVGCWAHVRRSTDGIAWTPVTAGDLAVGKLIPTSGPGPGMRAIGGGPGGFVAIGYAGDTRLDVAVWSSADGTSWARARLGSVFARGRVKAVTATAHGWLIVGSEFLPAGPRGAAWTSRDGRTWVRAAEGPAFDIGGYYNTLEEPGAGGFRDVVAHGDVVVAVGDTCDPGGRACRAATWHSADGGATWARSSGPDLAGNLGVVVRSSTAFVAFGQRCDSAATCIPIVASSDDGLAWTSTELTVLPAGGQIRAAAAVAGGIVAAGSGPNSVVLIATRDAKTWDLIHEESFQPTVGASAPPGYATIDELGVAAAANGAAVMAGTVRMADNNVPWRAFVAIVEAGQP
jgi:hypothetical protein